MMTSRTDLTVAIDQPKIYDFKHFYSQVVGAGRANEGLRADWQAHLKLAQRACGFKYVRFHGLYHDDMHVLSEVEGKHVYNFQYIDALFDTMLDMGVFWWKGHGSPPKDLDQWSDLVRATVDHWIQRYGLQEVRTWYFECWNEPNLSAFFKGSRSQYYALYECTVKTVKQLDADLRVGGPATSNYVPDTRFDGEWEDMEVQKQLANVEDIDSLHWRPVWVEHFLRWCHTRQLPVDFVSCHPYPTDWALDTSGSMSKRVRGLEATPNDLQYLRQIVSQSAYPSAEIHLTEWSSSPSSRDHAHDEVPAAIYIVRTMLASLNLVDTLAYWTFTDVFEEEGCGMTPFHGGFGLMNLQGIPKPAFHAFRLLKGLGKEVLAQNKSDSIVTRNPENGLISAILFHYPDEVKTSPPPAYNDPQAAEGLLKLGSPKSKKLVLKGLRPGSPFRVEKLSPGGPGDVKSAYRRLGSPKTLSRQIIKDLTAYAMDLRVSVVNADAEGVLVLEEDMAPWSLIALSQTAANL
ncbi:Beta-xylosidase [Penicillium subrubescens]|uniref:Beta-xylosidase n=1 Tax=Penicillium subrubescens TaxID=1316194 RepID=A0A1Q5TBE1_9EURO|nr:Beta-xylosidase [Penicillium subrubescens]